MNDPFKNLLGNEEEINIEHININNNNKTLDSMIMSEQDRNEILSNMQFYPRCMCCLDLGNPIKLFEADDNLANYICPSCRNLIAGDVVLILIVNREDITGEELLEKFSMTYGIDEFYLTGTSYLLNIEEAKKINEFLSPGDYYAVTSEQEVLLNAFTDAIKITERFNIINRVK